MVGRHQLSRRLFVTLRSREIGLQRFDATGQRVALLFPIRRWFRRRPSFGERGLERLIIGPQIIPRCRQSIYTGFQRLSVLQLLL